MRTLEEKIKRKKVEVKSIHKRASEEYKADPYLNSINYIIENSPFNNKESKERTKKRNLTLGRMAKAKLSY